MNSLITKTVVQVVVTAAAVSCTFIFVIVPLLDNLKENQTEINKMSYELQAATDKLNQLQALDRNKDNIKVTKDLIEAYWPNEAGSSDFIVDLEETTSEIPIIVDSLTVAETKTATTKSTKTTDSSKDTSSKKDTNTSKTTTTSDKSLDVTATFKSNYDNILLFFQKMESFSRFNTIESVSLSGFDKDSNLNLKIQGKIYYGE